MARVKEKPILIISILDPTGKEGLIKAALTLQEFDKTSISICTAIANQNNIEVDNLTWLSYEEIKRQLDAIGRRYWIDWAVITGVSDLEIVNQLVVYLHISRPGIKILWQPSLEKDEQSIPLNKQDIDLLIKTCTKVYLTLVSDQYLKAQLPTTPLDSIISTVLEKSNLLHIEEKKVMLYQKEQLNPYSFENPIEGEALAVNLSVHLQNGLDLDMATTRVFELLKSYSNN